MKNKILTLLLILTTALSLGLTACVSGGNGDPYSEYAGKYYPYSETNVKIETYWIELKADGTFAAADGQSGTFTISGIDISFSVSVMGEFTATIENGVMTLAGIRYKRDMSPNDTAETAALLSLTELYPQKEWTIVSGNELTSGLKTGANSSEILWYAYSADGYIAIKGKVEGYFEDINIVMIIEADGRIAIIDISHNETFDFGTSYQQMIGKNIAQIDVVSGERGIESNGNTIGINVNAGATISTRRIAVLFNLMFGYIKTEGLVIIA